MFLGTIQIIGDTSLMKRLLKPRIKYQVKGLLKLNLALKHASKCIKMRVEKVLKCHYRVCHNIDRVSHII